MKKSANKSGVTLVEAMVVIAIVTILLATIMTVAARIETRSKEQLTAATIEILSAALEQFHDFHYRYNTLFVPAYGQYDFPLDCNDFIEADLMATLGNALGFDTADVSIFGIDNGGSVVSPVDHDIKNSGCEAMYFFLSQIPQCRKTLDEIDKSLITSKGTADGVSVNRVIKIANTIECPLVRIVDAWGNPLRYDYYNEDWFFSGKFDKMWESRRSFPLITSAGHDERFNTNDDVNNK